MPLSDLLLLFGSVMLSGGIFFFIKEPSKRFLKLSLSFSGAFLFAISVLHLMPGVYAGSGPQVGIWIMAGFFLQLVLELFSEGIEHGHVHLHAHRNGSFPLSMMLSLSLHSFLEGIPLSTAVATAHPLQTHSHSLLYGIILHHLPVAFALVSLLVAAGLSKQKTLLLLAVFAVMAPLGAISGSLFQTHSSVHFYNNIMALVIGIFLHISTTILFESGSDHRFNIYKLMAIVTGGVMGIISFAY